MNRMTDEEQFNMIIMGAVALGFKEVDKDVYQCTKEQIIQLCAIVAQEAANQALAAGE